jgi:hypothetical protein
MQFTIFLFTHIVYLLFIPIYLKPEADVNSRESFHNNSSEHSQSFYFL